MTSMRTLLFFASVLLALVGCSKAPDIQGAWYFDYEATRAPEFPNPQYESARLLIADIEPRYGTINVDGNTVVLGGAVCKVKKLDDEHGLECDERGTTTKLSLFLKDNRLIVQGPGGSANAAKTAVFSRTKQDPFAIYGVDPNAKELVEDTAIREKVAEPTPDVSAGKLVGYARTQSFNAFFEPDSLASEGRYTSVRIILNYLEPQTENTSLLKSLSSVQTITFDCPGSNYRLDRYVQHSETNGKGTVVADSSASTDYKPDMKPVPPNSVNEVLYMRVCR